MRSGGSSTPDFISSLEAKVSEQLKSQRVAYLLGAGSSYLDGAGYPLAAELWDLIRDRIADAQKRAEIQAKLDSGAAGIEHALDLLDDGGAMDTPHRHLVTAAIADYIRPKTPNLEVHIEFLRRLYKRGDPCLRVFSLNYDPLVERAAEAARIRIVDGFLGTEDAFFDPAVFEERIGRIRGTYRGRQFDETVKPIHLLKLHGSLGWYESSQRGVRCCSYASDLPEHSRRLMIPPQRRKATDTMLPPYAALWSTFRGCLGHHQNPINRLASFGYGFADEHVNAVIEAALARSDFTLIILTKALPDGAWARWSVKPNTVVVTETRSSVRGLLGPGHRDLWRFERLCKEV
ncbi:MAG: SIR2 family protein [Acidobacteriia bacterium]|nr:SIR2 family protein [Terriglobia bacterium]